MPPLVPEVLTFSIPSGAPCLEGHFPGDPVVPGVVLLERVLEGLNGGGCGGCGLPSVKFLFPVRAGETVNVAYRCEPGRVFFTCRVEGRTVLQGQGHLERKHENAAGEAD